GGTLDFGGIPAAGVGAFCRRAWADSSCDRSKTVVFSSSSSHSLSGPIPGGARGFDWTDGVGVGGGAPAFEGAGGGGGAFDAPGGGGGTEDRPEGTGGGGGAL